MSANGARALKTRRAGKIGLSGGCGAKKWRARRKFLSKEKVNVRRDERVLLYRWKSVKERSRRIAMQVERWPRSVSFITERFKFFHAVGECYPAPSSVPLLARHLLPYWRRLLLSCSLIALDRSCPLSQSATPDSRTQPCPAARPKGKNEKLPGGACSYPGNLSFSLPRGGGWPGPLPVLFKLLSRHKQVL